MKHIFYFFIFFMLCSCSSDEPNYEFTINDLLYTAWTGEQTEILENGTSQTIDFIILFSTEKEGQVTYLDSNGTPFQNFPIYYRIKGSIISFKGAFEGEYRIINHSQNTIKLEAYLPNHSIITLSRK